MDELDRSVRAAVYRLLVAGGTAPTVEDLARDMGIDLTAATGSLHRLAAERRLVLTDDGGAVAMAHPFSGIPTAYQSRIGGRTWWANCAWDAFSILALLGDGSVAETDGIEQVWSVRDGVVSPTGLVHFVVPARRFWDDIGFT